MFFTYVHPLPSLTFTIVIFSVQCLLDVSWFISLSLYLYLSFPSLSSSFSLPLPLSFCLSISHIFLTLSLSLFRCLPVYHCIHVCAARPLCLYVSPCPSIYLSLSLFFLRLIMVLHFLSHLSSSSERSPKCLPRMFL